MNWEDWKYNSTRRGNVGEQASSSLSPALASHAAKLWCFWAAGDELKTLQYSTFSANAWSTPSNACPFDYPRKPRSAPRAAVLDGTLQVMFIDQDHNLMHYKWGETSLEEVSIVSKGKVDRFALEAQGGALHLVYRLKQEQTSWYSQWFGIEQWDQTVTQLCVEADGPHNPTLAVESGSLWLMKWDASGVFQSWMKSENKFQKKDFVTKVPLQPAPGEIAATSAADRLFLSYLTGDSLENIETLHFKDESKLERIYGDTAGSIPSLAVHNGTLFCAWNDSNTNILRYALKPTFEIWPLKAWMSSLGDNKKLSQITIPGTHDSCAKSDWPNSQRLLLQERFFGTQNATLLSQLTAGIRFFDIRGRFKKEDSFGTKDPMACHGDYLVEPELEIAEVFKVCYDFLDENTSETIIMSLKCEDESKMNQFAQAVQTLILERQNCWHLISDTIPTLGDVRGKIVLIRRFPDLMSSNQFGIDGVTNWPSNASSPDIAEIGSLNLVVQDRWNLTYNYKSYRSDTPIIKFDEVKRMLTRAGEDNRKQVWYLNFTSATAVGWASPSWIARGQPFETPVGVSYTNGVNHLLLEHLEKNPKGHFGTIVLDFMDTPEELVSMIVNTNVQYLN